MSSPETEDESQSLDAGWDDVAPSAPGSADADEADEAEIDEAWDSLPPPVSLARASTAPSMSPATEEVDSGWDDAPAPGLGGAATGKRRPHRQRRVKTGPVEVTASASLLPRPAEPTKKHQRELARKQRAHAAQVKGQRKTDKKVQRAEQAREQAAARLRQTEAEAQARQARQEERERERAAKPKPAKRESSRAAPAQGMATPKASVVSRAESLKPADKPAIAPPKSKLRPGVVVTLAILLAVVLLLVLRK